MKQVKQMDRKTEIYLMGKLYGLMAKTLPDIIGTPLRMSQASWSPFVGFSQGYNYIIKNKKLSKRLDEKIARIIDRLDMRDSFADEYERISLEETGTWQIGYYAGKADKRGISHQRREAGLSQAELADLLNEKGSSYTAEMIERWENGTENPSDQELIAIAEILDCTVYDITDNSTVDEEIEIDNPHLSI